MTGWSRVLGSEATVCVNESKIPPLGFLHSSVGTARRSVMQLPPSALDSQNRLPSIPKPAAVNLGMGWGVASVGTSSGLGNEMQRWAIIIDCHWDLKLEQQGNGVWLTNHVRFTSIYNDKPLSPSLPGTYPTPAISASVIHVFKYSFIPFSKMSHIIEQVNQQLQTEPSGEANHLVSLFLQMGHRKMATFCIHIRGGPGVVGCAPSPALQPPCKKIDPQFQ